MKSINLFALTFLLLPSACGNGDGTPEDTNPPSCQEDTRDEAFVAGLSKTGEASYLVALMDSNPAPPAKGDNIWSMELSDPDGNPLAGLDIDVSAYMPDHGHYSLAVPTITDDGAGAYTIDPVNLFMPGYWEITLHLLDPVDVDNPDDDIELDAVVFKFCVEG